MPYRTALALLGLVPLAGCSGPGPAAPPPPPDPAPEIGRWGGIDVGARGVKPIVMTFVRAPDGWDFVTDTSLDSKNLDLGTPGPDGKLDPKRLADTAAAVAEFEKAMREKHGLPPERVRVVVSSGVLSRMTDKAAAQADLTAALQKATGRPPEYIDGRKEAELAARAIISPAGRAGRMVVDVGSGNTKFGWYTADGFRNATLDSGTKAFHDRAAKEAGEKKQAFADAAAGLRGPVLTDPLRKGLAAAGGADRVADVQLIGGAAWALATLTHPGTGKDTRVPVSAADLAAFAELARLKPDEARERALKNVPDAARADAGREVERVQKVFTPEELQAGAEVLRAAFEALDLGGAGKKVVFFQKGQYAWMAGHLMTEAKLPE